MPPQRNTPRRYRSPEGTLCQFHWLCRHLGYTMFRRMGPPCSLLRSIRAEGACGASAPWATRSATWLTEKSAVELGLQMEDPSPIPHRMRSEERRVGKEGTKQR